MIDKTKYLAVTVTAVPGAEVAPVYQRLGLFDSHGSELPEPARLRAWRHITGCCKAKGEIEWHDAADEVIVCGHGKPLERTNRTIENLAQEGQQA